MADGFDVNDVDYLRQVDRTTGAVTPATPTAAGTQSIEAHDLEPGLQHALCGQRQPVGDVQHHHGRVDGANPIPSPAPSDPLQGEFGAITVADVDGISFDPATGSCMA